jgi:hypothetical protein
MRLYNRCRLALFGGLLLMAGAGCGPVSTSRYIPPEQKARQALEMALAAWQEGKPPEEVAVGPPVIRAVDSKWKSGQKLSKYQILSEESESGPTFFSVRLTLKSPAKEQTVRYVVVGRDPLWVYREDDYKSTAGM